MTRPLLITDDDALREDVVRLAAAAGAGLELARVHEAWLRSWSRAPLVLVGTDVAGQAADRAPARRTAVHVVGWEGHDGEVLRHALALGAETVAVLPAAEARLVEQLTDLADAGRLPGAVIGVVGGSGGVGATTLACAIGQAAADRGTVLVVDGDPLGPGADRVLGLEREPGVRWDDLAGGGGRLGAASLRRAVPSRAGLGVLAWPASGIGHPGQAAVREALSAARRGHDLVVLDLPRRVDDRVRDLTGRCDRVLVVTAATLTGVASTQRVCAAFGEGLGPGASGDPGGLRLAVRGRGLEPEEVARLTGVPMWARVPEQRGLVEAVDLGVGPLRSRRAPLGRVARELLDRLVADLAQDAGARPVRVPA